MQIKIIAYKRATNDSVLVGKNGTIRFNPKHAEKFGFKADESILLAVDPNGFAGNIYLVPAKKDQESIAHTMKMAEGKEGEKRFSISAKQFCKDENVPMPSKFNITGGTDKEIGKYIQLSRVVS